MPGYPREGQNAQVSTNWPFLQILAQRPKGINVFRPSHSRLADRRSRIDRDPPHPIESKGLMSFYTFSGRSPFFSLFILEFEVRSEVTFERANATVVHLTVCTMAARPLSRSGATLTHLCLGFGFAPTGHKPRSNLYCPTQGDRLWVRPSRR